MPNESARAGPCSRARHQGASSSTQQGGRGPSAERLGTFKRTQKSVPEALAFADPACVGRRLSWQRHWTWEERVKRRHRGAARRPCSESIRNATSRNPITTTQPGRACLTTSEARLDRGDGAESPAARRSVKLLPWNGHGFHTMCEHDSLLVTP